MVCLNSTLNLHKQMLNAGKGGPAAFAHGMCKDCYMNFLKVTGGLDTPGANPPAFTAGQIKADEGQQVTFPLSRYFCCIFQSVDLSGASTK